MTQFFVNCVTAKSLSVSPALATIDDWTHAVPSQSNGRSTAPCSPKSIDWKPLLPLPSNHKQTAQDFLHKHYVLKLQTIIKCYTILYIVHFEMASVFNNDRKRGLILFIILYLWHYLLENLFCLSVDLLARWFKMYSLAKDGCSVIWL